MKSPFLAVATLVLALASAAFADEIALVNPSFEANTVSGGLPTGWQGGGDFGPGNVGAIAPSNSQFPLGVPNGMNAAYISIDSGANFFGSLSQATSAVLAADKTYTFSIYVGRSATNTLPQFQITLQDTADGFSLAYATNDPSSGVHFVASPAAGTFQQYSISYTVAAGNPRIGDGITLSLNAINGAGGGVGTAFFDDAHLAVVPEPTIAALIGAGGLALCALRRGRRSR